MEMDNYVSLQLRSIGENVALVRMMVSGFLYPYDLTMEALDEIKIALSEAVSNCILHGYQDSGHGQILVRLEVAGGRLMVQVTDYGIGIADIAQAMEPAFSTREEHMGLGFAFMQTFMDQLEVISQPGEGTTVLMYRQLPAIIQQSDQVG